jgi:hypothetical protein
VYLSLSETVDFAALSEGVEFGLEVLVRVGNNGEAVAVVRSSQSLELCDFSSSLSVPQICFGELLSHLLQRSSALGRGREQNPRAFLCSHFLIRREDPVCERERENKLDGGRRVL